MYKNYNYMYAVILSICIVFYFAVFVLDLKFVDFFNNPDGFNKLLLKFNIKENYLGHNGEFKVQYPPLKPMIDNKEEILFDHPELLNMQVMNNNKETRLMAHNEDIEAENSADFQNQQTNINEFIKNNKSLLFNNHKSNIIMTDEWNLKGAQLFNKILNNNNNNNKIEPYSTDNYALI